uniref:Serine/threonine-protein phosphatase 2A activator n=1 Tax=Anopheles culicifacies TaxID=139723 RepID=A0A182MAC3_9DIPT
MSESGAAADGESKREFVVPEKLIKSPTDMELWRMSECYYDLLGFISSMSVALQGTRNSQEVSVPPIVEKLMKVLDRLEQLAIETPPIDQPARFGNVAFKSWFQKMQSESMQLIGDVLPDTLKEATKELNVYFVDCFGNPTRIDYGTGHELAFIMFLMCLFKIGAFERKDEVAVGLKVNQWNKTVKKTYFKYLFHHHSQLFQKYIILARKLQVTYRMEPAGSHGVWSLDDFQFVPFIWGSAQLAVNSPIEPAQFVEEKSIAKYKKELMFVSCIDYIQQVKTGHFAEHSNQLWSISAVPQWSKICTGLIKMYQKEVLSKFPVIQHVYFGSILTLKTVKPGTMLPNPRLGMIPRQHAAAPAPVPAPPKFPGGDGM